MQIASSGLYKGNVPLYRTSATSKMDPLLYFDSLFKTIMMYLNFFGVDLVEERNGPVLRTFLLWLLMVVAIMCQFYTAVTYSLEEGLKSFTMLGIMLQVSAGGIPDFT